MMETTEQQSPLLRINITRHDHKIGSVIGVQLEGHDEAVDCAGFAPLLEISGADLGESDAAFLSAKGATWVLEPPPGFDFPYDMLIQMDPETAVRVEGKISFGIRERAKTAFAKEARPDKPVDTSGEELQRGKEELRRLMESVWRAEYRTEAPNWRPLDDLPGMVSQMDNIYAGVRSQRDQARWDLHNPPVAPESVDLGADAERGA